jgi:hypothetical protein
MNKVAPDTTDCEKTYPLCHHCGKECSNIIRFNIHTNGPLSVSTLLNLDEADQMTIFVKYTKKNNTTFYCTEKCEDDSAAHNDGK